MIVLTLLASIYCSLSHVQLSATPWTAVHQALLRYNNYTQLIACILSVQFDRIIYIQTCISVKPWPLSGKYRYPSCPEVFFGIPSSHFFQGTIDMLSALQISLYFLEFVYIESTICTLFFSTLFHSIFLRSIPVKYIKASFLLLLSSISLHKCTKIYLSFYQLLDIWGCFPFGGITNRSTMNIHVQVFVSTYASFPLM